MRRACLGWIATVAVALLGARAGAQSRRYPAPTPDPDEVAESSSEYWERVLSPGRGPFAITLAKARRLIDGRAPAELREAIGMLDLALSRAGDLPDGLVARGWAKELLADWSGCAADYQRARTADPAYQPAPGLRPRGGLDHGAGVCLARAGRVDDAEVVLAAATATTEPSAELWLRLGEVHLAQGRLTEAVAEFDRALAVARTEEVITIQWMRLLAFDRARMPAEAGDAADVAAALDRNANRVLSPALPFVVPADQLYATALAMDAIGQPEVALPYFREYLRVAGSTPWRRRAEEHVAALRTLDLSARWSQLQWTAVVDAAAVRTALRKVLPAARRCLRAHPGLVLEVRWVHGSGLGVVVLGPGPRPPGPGAGGGVIGAAQPPTTAAAGPQVRTVLNLGHTDPTEATACTVAATRKLALPALAKGAWMQLRFPVVAD
ncbi:MAG: tetratricopeptide repeat protein [Kofleriaceae bacterium]|jgi:tetratricopeptide (TPR) repeat protein|nr:tetratricopeptide repeat protein [Kofleriaceae bacterium]